jgi:signal transduction histidine kinase
MNALTQEQEKAQDDLFVASLSHEMKRPLAALQAAASGLDLVLESVVAAAQGGGLPPALGAALDFLGGRLTERRPPVVLTGLEGERRIAQVARRLGEAGIPAPLREDAARIVVRCGWEPDLDRIVPLLEKWGGDPLLPLLEASGRIRSSLSTIRGSVDRLMEFTLTLRSGLGGLLPDLGTFDLRGCLERGVAAVDHEKPPEVRVEIRCDPGLGISGSPTQIQQVIANLVGNAQRAVCAEGGRVLVEGRHSPEAALLGVEDDGPGIPEEVRAKLFTPFFTTRSDGKGTGLGLYIARRIVESHGGTLRFTSRPGCTRFEARLPRTVPAGRR